VIEIGHMLMGPYCGMILADLGAKVIKIESAEGDIARNVGPHRVGAHNAYFASLNRNKSSIVLNLQSSHGQARLHALVRESHALLTNLRPAAIQKLGLTYEHLRSFNPGIVCLALTGYGLESPWSERPAYDYVIQAGTGIMSMTGDPSGAPTKTGYSAVDNSTALMGAIGLLAKLVQGQGGQVDVAMHDTMLSQLNYVASAWLNAGEPARRYADSAHPYIVPAQNFRTADGWLTLFVTHDGFWRSFCSEIGRADWSTDPAFATMQARSTNRQRVLEAVSTELMRESTESWIRRLRPLGLVVAAVESLEAALQSEQVIARGMVVEIPVANATLRLVGNPIRIDGLQVRYSPPPLLDEHAHELARPVEP
jgi:CoA:oxalate CoA-transferase